MMQLGQTREGNSNEAETENKSKIATAAHANAIPYEEVRQRIIGIRQQSVILDADVAKLYGVETKRVNEAVRNNPDKFLADYMFELTEEETCCLWSKISSTNFSSKRVDCKSKCTFGICKCTSNGNVCI